MRWRFAKPLAALMSVALAIGMTSAPASMAAENEPAASNPGPARIGQSSTATDRTAADANLTDVLGGRAELSAEAAEPQPLPAPTLAIDIDLTRQIMTVTEEGGKRREWPISSARYGYSTPAGTYRPTWMAKMWYSRQYDMAPMPHAIFFHKGVAIHGTYDTGALGRPASHGCVRLARKNAATLFGLVTDHGKERTEIVVRGKPAFMDAEVAAVSPRSGMHEPTVRLPRSARAYRYLPPSYYGRQHAYSNERAQPRHQYAAPRRPQRAFVSGYPYGYGF